jgi:L-threonylcarbamoyladenylate synthase
MRSELLPAGEAGAVDRAADVLAGGGLVVFPTDTVYGLAVAAGVPGATERIFAAKDRPDAQALAVLVGDRAQAAELGDLDGPRGLAELLDEAWPGPLTVVVARRPGTGTDLDLGGDPGTIGLRWPDHDLVRALAERVGALVTTSANRHGVPTPELAVDAAASLAEPADLVLDGGRCEGLASTVVLCTEDPPRIVRQGAFPAEAVRAHLA